MGSTPLHPHTPPGLPTTRTQEERLLDLLGDLHKSFGERVRASRGARLARGQDTELFSGRAWTGRQALKLGLLDGVGEMREVMMQEHGPKTRFILCSDPPQPSLLGALFGAASDGAPGLGALLAGRAGGGGAGGAEDVAYAACRGAAAAAMDELEQRALWARFGVRV